jgi:hypothetical protein
MCADGSGREACSSLSFRDRKFDLGLERSRYSNIYRGQVNVTGDAIENISENFLAESPASISCLHLFRRDWASAVIASEMC